MKTFNLDNEPKIASGFKTPEHYFDDFSAGLLQKLQNTPTVEETTVIPIFRRRKNILMAVAAVLVLALLIPIAYQVNQKNKDIDTVTLENYLAEESNLNPYELIGEIEPENSNPISNTTELSPETIEEILINNPNIENLVIENQSK